MHRCPHCSKSLGLNAWLTMNTGNTPTCPHCGHRYGWSASGAGMLVMFAVVAAGAAGLLRFAGELSLMGNFGAIAALMAASGYIAIRSMRTVAR